MDEIVGATVDAEGWSAGVSEGVRGSLWDFEDFERGVVVVGPALTNLLINSGVFSGVTLSINWKAGRSRTVVLWSESSGTGMFDADSLSRYRVISKI